MGKRRSFKQVRDAFNKSPYHRLLGIEVTDIRKGKSRVRMAFRQKLSHLDGFVAGGAIASLADSSVAMALMSLVEPSKKIMVIEFKINFFVRVYEGELTAETEIIHKNSNTAVGATEVMNEDGKLVAKLIGTYNIERVD